MTREKFRMTREKFRMTRLELSAYEELSDSFEPYQRNATLTFCIRNIVSADRYLLAKREEQPIMSQQMNYDEGIGERQTPPYQRYQASYQDPFIASSGQKLSSRDFGRGANAGQRLALAIVSIVMLVAASAIIFGDSNIVVNLSLMIVFGLICFTIIAVNAIFNITH
jgi:hypothetical protein